MARGFFPRLRLSDGLGLVLIVALSLSAGMWIERQRGFRPKRGQVIKQWLGANGETEAEITEVVVFDAKNPPGAPVIPATRQVPKGRR
jgi:hypothetical protein